MLTRLALALRAEALDLMVTEEAAGLVVEEEEDIRLLLIHFCLRNQDTSHYSESYWPGCWRPVAGQE